MNFKNFFVLLLVVLLVSAPVMANSNTLRSGSYAASKGKCRTGG